MRGCAKRPLVLVCDLPQLLLRLFKYPRWLPWMWKSEQRVLEEMRGRRESRMRQGKGKAKKS